MNQSAAVLMLCFALLVIVAVPTLGRATPSANGTSQSLSRPSFLATATSLPTSAFLQTPETDRSARPANNPIPDTFTNLQILPKDIAKAQLVKLMKQFSITFKVRCMYCHAVSDDLTIGSFASDEKDTKIKARELLKLIVETRSSAKP